MSKKREFGDGPIYTITNYIMWFFGGNIYFMLCNIPFLFILLSFNGNFTTEYWILFILFSIPIGPAYTALLSVMGKLVRENDINLTRDYFKAYKTNFFQSLFFWTAQLVIFAVLLIDIRFFAIKSYGRFFIPIFYALMILDALVGIYIYPILSRFYLKNLDIIKISFYYLVKKWKVTLSCVGLFIITYFLLNTKSSSVVILFILAVLCYGIMFFQNDLLKELQIKFDPESVEEESEI